MSKVDLKKIKESESSVFLGLDLVRFLAAFIVMFYHLGYTTWASRVSTARDFMSQWDSTYSYQEIRDISWFGWVGVEVFFVLSGFVIVYSAGRSTAQDFFWGRVFRLYPAAWVSATASLLIVIVFGAYTSVESVLLMYGKAIILWPFGPWIDGAYWTLGVEMAFYFVIFMVMLTQRKSLITEISLLIGIASSLFYTYILYKYLIYGIDSVSVILKSTRLINLSLLGHGVFFAIGVILFKYTQKTMRLKDSVLLIIFCFFCFVEIYIGSLVKSDQDAVIRNSRNDFAPVLLWMFFLLVMFLSLKYNNILTLRLDRFRTSIRQLGLITYPLYLIHSILGALILAVCGSILIDKWVALFISFGVCIAVSSCIVSYLEKPLQRYLNIVKLNYSSRE